MEKISCQAPFTYYYRIFLDLLMMIDDIVEASDYGKLSILALIDGKAFNALNLVAFRLKDNYFSGKLQKVKLNIQILSNSKLIACGPSIIQYISIDISKFAISFYSISRRDEGQWNEDIKKLIAI